DRTEQVLRDAFVDYDCSAIRGSILMRQALREAKSSSRDIELAVRAALTASGAFNSFQRLCPLASEEVIGHANAVMKTLEVIRDLHISGEELSSDAYLAARGTLFTDLAVMRNAMRHELGLKTVAIETFTSDRYG